MFRSIELKRQRLRVSDEAKKIVDASEREKRGMTTDEEKDYRALYERIDSLSHEIVESETREQRELEEVARLRGATVARPGQGHRGSMSWSGSGQLIGAHRAMSMMRPLKLAKSCGRISRFVRLWNGGDC